MPDVQVNGIQLHYDEQGSGEPMLLIMGLAAQMIAWPPPMLDALQAKGFRVIRFDNRDIGLSTKTDAPRPRRKDVLAAAASARFAKSDYLLSDMADDAAGLLDALGIGSAHVVGVSMGGMIAQELTIRHPEKVRSLTSIMSNTGDRRQGRPATTFLPALRRSMMAPPAETLDQAVDMGVLAWRQISGPQFDEQEIRRLVRAAVERDPDPIGRVRQLLAINASPDRTPALREVTAPTLVIHGLLDRLVTPSGGMATAKAVPGSRLLMFPDMAHDLPRGRIPEIVDAITANAARAGEAAPAAASA